MMWARPKEDVQAGAPPHKNNLIGTAAEDTTCDETKDSAFGKLYMNESNPN